MMDKKDKITINTNEFSNEPIMRAPPQELGNGQGAPPINDRISLAIKYVIEEQEQLYSNQEETNKELKSVYNQLTNAQERLEILLDRSKKNQDSLSRKNVSLKKLTSKDTTLVDKEQLATAIITVHESDL